MRRGSTGLPRTELEDAWSRERQSGSHEVWQSADGSRVVTVAGKDSERSRSALAALRRQTRIGGASKEYLVIHEQAEDGGWGAHSPGVEGVFALGATRAEVEARMAEALAAHLEFLREQGSQVPEPHTEAGRVAA